MQPARHRCLPGQAQQWAHKLRPPAEWPSVTTRELAAQVRLLHEMLNLEPWCYFPLTQHFSSSQHQALAAGCPALPGHMTTSVAPLQGTPNTPGQCQSLAACRPI